MTRRIPRPVRRADRKLTTAWRNRRGPRVPVAVMRYLQREWARRHDAVTGRWGAALRTAWQSLIRRARRGVASALDTVGLGQFVTNVPPPTPATREEWELEITATAAATEGAGIANQVMSGFVDMVQWFARGVGAHYYIWTTRRDAAVRQLHQQLEGTRQSWDDPPVAGSGGWRGHPGEPAGCRCTPFPTI